MTVRIRFTAPGQIERAPADKSRTGFEIETIPLGTEMSVSDASYRFWKARGCVVLLTEPEPIEPEPIEPDVTSFSPSKTSVRRAAADARKALSVGDQKTLSTCLDTVIGSDLVDIDLTVLTTAREDLKTLFATQRIATALPEIVSTLINVENLLAPPSMRRRGRA